MDAIKLFAAGQGKEEPVHTVGGRKNRALEDPDRPAAQAQPEGQPEDCDKAQVPETDTVVHGFAANQQRFEVRLTPDTGPEFARQVGNGPIQASLAFLS
jgi:hypothetical protein